VRGAGSGGKSLIMRIGVTGSTGALGGRIVEAIKRNGSIAEPYPGDVRSASELNAWASGLDAIAHCAAVVPTQEVSGFLLDAIAINVAGAANVARAARAAGCRLAYISTSHVYRSSDIPVDEKAPIAPISLYGLTKLQGEQWVREFCPDALILRVFSFFDARQAQSFLVPALIARIKNAPANAKLDLMGGHSRRDIADAIWLGTACARLIEDGASGIVNCAAGRRDSVHDIAVAVARALGRTDIEWNVVQDRPADYLLADTARLHSLAPDLPDFDLDAALAHSSATSDPRPADALNKRLGAAG
jgi:nucleoside-diphosphate-sugar epimerase